MKMLSKRMLDLLVWSHNTTLMYVYYWCKADVGTIGYLHPNMAACETGCKVFTPQYP